METLCLDWDSGTHLLIKYDQATKSIMWHHAQRWVFWRGGWGGLSLLILRWCNNCGLSVKICGNRKVLDLSGDLLVSKHQCLLLMYCIQTLQREFAVILYTLTDPLVMLRWQEREFLSGGAVPTYTQCFIQQGRCKVTGVTWPWPDHGHRWHCSWDQDWISVSVLPWGENTSSSYSRGAHHCHGTTALRHDTKTHLVISQNKLWF